MALSRLCHGIRDHASDPETFKFPTLKHNSHYLYYLLSLLPIRMAVGDKGTFVTFKFNFSTMWPDTAAKILIVAARHKSALYWFGTAPLGGPS